MVAPIYEDGHCVGLVDFLGLLMGCLWRSVYVLADIVAYLSSLLPEGSRHKKKIRFSDLCFSTSQMTSKKVLEIANFSKHNPLKTLSCTASALEGLTSLFVC